MKNIWLSSDSHFGHSNIIKYSSRPYSSVEEMDETLIQNWNMVVKPGDDIYYLGDFSWSDPKPILKRLNGNKMMAAIGNHDKLSIHENAGWSWIKNYHELKFDGKMAVLFHYPMRSWNKAFHGSYHFFGHVHNKLPPYGKSRDVGVDCWNYFPVNIEELINSLKDAELVEKSGD